MPTHLLSPQVQETAVSYETSPETFQGFTMVPKYDIEASAGHGRMVHSEQIVDHLAFKTSWIKRVLGISPKNLLLIIAVGDSMKPTIMDGDLLLLDQGFQDGMKDASYSIFVDDTLLIKSV